MPLSLSVSPLGVELRMAERLGAKAPGLIQGPEGPCSLRPLLRADVLRRSRMRSGSGMRIARSTIAVRAAPRMMTELPTER